MMRQYEMIDENDLDRMTKEDLRRKYNELVEDVWYFRKKAHDMSEAYDDLMDDYDEVSDKLYG